MKSTEIKQTTKQEPTTAAEQSETLPTVVAALNALNAMGEWSIRHLLPGRHILYLDGKRYGTWDSEQNEFAD
jgi:hypothetical protein